MHMHPISYTICFRYSILFAPVLRPLVDRLEDDREQRMHTLIQQCLQSEKGIVFAAAGTTGTAQVKLVHHLKRKEDSGEFSESMAIFYVGDGSIDACPTGIDKLGAPKATQRPQHRRRSLASRHGKRGKEGPLEGSKGRPSETAHGLDHLTTQLHWWGEGFRVGAEGIRKVNMKQLSYGTKGRKTLLFMTRQYRCG